MVGSPPTKEKRAWQRKKRRFLGPLVLTAGLVGGGVAGFVLGVPGVSSAQTTTTAPATVAPAAGAPDATQPDRPAGDPKNCPDKAGIGIAPATGSSPAGAATNTSSRFRGGGGARV